MKKRVAPSAALEAAIDELLSEGLGDSEQLAEVGRLGARLVLQRAVEEEVAEDQACGSRSDDPDGGLAHGGILRWLVLSGFVWIGESESSLARTQDDTPAVRNR